MFLQARVLVTLSACIFLFTVCNLTTEGRPRVRLGLPFLQPATPRFTSHPAVDYLADIERYTAPQSEDAIDLLNSYPTPRTRTRTPAAPALTPTPVPTPARTPAPTPIPTLFTPTPTHVSPSPSPTVAQAVGNSSWAEPSTLLDDNTTDASGEDLTPSSVLTYDADLRSRLWELGNASLAEEYDPDKQWFWGGTLHEAMVTLLRAPLVNRSSCNVHALEVGYWEGSEPSWIPVNTVGSTWDLLASTSFHTCAMQSRRSVDVSALYEATADSDVIEFKMEMNASYPLVLRPLGTVCPSLDQMKREQESVQLGYAAGSLAELFLTTQPVIIGDSLSFGTGAPPGQSWLSVLKTTLEDLTGTNATWNKPCMGSKSGFSLFKFYQRAKKRSTKYFLNPDPVRGAKRCFAMKPGVLVFALGTNDFVEQTEMTYFRKMLEWTLAWAIRKSQGSVRGLVILTPIIPVIGRWYEASTSHSWHVEALSVLRTTLTHVAAKHNITHAVVVDTDTAVRWCEEHNFVDGTHLSVRGYYLMATEVLRVMGSSFTL